MFDIQKFPKQAGRMNTKNRQIKSGVGRMNMKRYKIVQSKICNSIIVKL